MQRMRMSHRRLVLNAAKVSDHRPLRPLRPLPHILLGLCLMVEALRKVSQRVWPWRMSAEDHSSSLQCWMAATLIYSPLSLAGGLRVPSGASLRPTGVSQVILVLHCFPSVDVSWADSSDLIAICDQDGCHIADCLFNITVTNQVRYTTASSSSS